MPSVHKSSYTQGRLREKKIKLRIVAQTYNPSTEEAVTRASLPGEDPSQTDTVRDPVSKQKMVK